MDLKQFEQQILKTGFALEHDVSTALKEKGWSVISNKFYVDDNEETVREIDLIAYKASQIQHFSVYTALIISCKKNDDNVWALLCRSLNRSDPNRIWHPVHAWSNDRSLQYHLAKEGFGSNYHGRIEKGTLNALEDPELDIFAFQEMKRQSGAPQNDKAIFGSITSLMKAQAYELRALPTRKTKPCIYHFSLVSVVDAEMIRLMFKGDAPSASEVESEQYLASYIIDKKQKVSRIRFIRASAFKRAIAEYDELHMFNCKVFSDYCNEFYNGVLEDWDRTKIFIEDFRKAVWLRLQWHIYAKFNKEFKRDQIGLSWKADRGYVAVTLPLEKYHLDFLNDDEKAKAVVAEALSTLYRYKGLFEFAEDDDIPF